MMSPRFHRRWLLWWLPLVLLFAQQAAMAHMASHAGDRSSNPEKTLAHLKLCGKCLAVEKLSHTPPVAEHHLALAEAAYVYTSFTAAPAPSLVNVRQSCRDPPQHL